MVQTSQKNARTTVCGLKCENFSPHKKILLYSIVDLFSRLHANCEAIIIICSVWLSHDTCEYKVVDKNGTPFPCGAHANSSPPNTMIKMVYWQFQFQHHWVICLKFQLHIPNLPMVKCDIYIYIYKYISTGCLHTPSAASIMNMQLIPVIFV